MSVGGTPDPRRVAELFEALADLPPAEAARRLADECAGDAVTRDAVAQVLLSDRAAPAGFLASARGPALLAEALRGLDPDATVGGAAAVDDEPLAGSSRLGRYYVLHKLGEGGMGLVYVGYDDALDRRVALKVLRRGTAVREWLLREGQALGRLSHPNVVAVHEVGEQDGRAFLAMEYIEGPTLRAWLDAGPRSFADTLHLFLQAGRGLHAAHRAGLVHRDFKPDNVIMGRDGRARVADFGIVMAQGAPAEALAAPAVAPNALSSPLTQTGMLLGTPAYMAPEQLLGARATPLSDQYSFCVALYRAAYGTPPHPAADLIQMRERVLNEPPAPPPPRPEVPAWLPPILLRGLARDPSQRFASMDELLRAIDRHLPRDPELDPTPMVRERRLLAGVLAVNYLISTGPMLSDTCARVLMRPAALVAVPLFWTVTMFSGIAWTWRTLSRNRYGKTLAGLFVVAQLAFLGHRLVALRLGERPEQILVEDMLLIATVLAVLSQVFERWHIWLAAVTALPAIVGAFLPERVPLLWGLMGVASGVIFGIRAYVDRNLRPEAIVRPHENAEDPVGSSPASANEE